MALDAAGGPAKRANGSIVYQGGWYLDLHKMLGVTEGGSGGTGKVRAALGRQTAAARAQAAGVVSVSGWVLGAQRDACCRCSGSRGCAAGCWRTVASVPVPGARRCRTAPPLLDTALLPYRAAAAAAAAPQAARCCTWATTSTATSSSPRRTSGGAPCWWCPSWSWSWRSWGGAR